MRITTVRIIVQAVVMALFLALVLLATFAHLDEMPALRFWVSKFLEIDPLIAIATSITTHTLYKGLIWSLLLLIPTLFLGRFFFGLFCPFGNLQHFMGWAFNTRGPSGRIESNRYRPLYHLKYCILIAMLVAAAFGTLQIGLLDPICLFHRSLTTSVLPAISMPPFMARLLGDPREHQLAWIVGFVALVLVSMSLVVPRFFCRALCPLGATLGLLSRFALWRIERDPDKCTNCNRCLSSCEGACDPDGKLRKSECLVCFNCIEDCPHGALSFAFLPTRQHEVTGPDLSKRRALFAAVVGVLFYPFARLSGRTTRNFSSKVIRPPGAVEEQEFLERCIKCGQCIRVCPTNVLQPAGLEAGLEGLWTPVMNYRMGPCQRNCTACGHVCPTGAIQQLTVDKKLGRGPHEKDGPIKLGTAHFDRSRCLPWSKNKPCVVCEEVCPTSPKAIHTEYCMLLIRDGKKQVTTATPTTVTLAEYPLPGQRLGQPCAFRPDQFRGDQSTTYHVQIIHRDGTSETHQILGNDAETLMIGEPDKTSNQESRGSTFATPPVSGEVAAIHIEYKVPKVDIDLCIGCGACEHHCPVVGDRRAVYVTAEGETRSEAYGEGDRNRAVRPERTGGATP